MIKRLSILIILILSIGFMSQAEFRYGIRLGGMFANARVKRTPGISISGKSGFSGGIVFEYQHPNNGFATDIGISYTRYTIKFRDPQMYPENFGRNFLEIPLHFKYKFWIPKFYDLIAPMVYTGPSLLIRVGDRHRTQVSTWRCQPGWDVGIGIDFANFIQLSGGYRFGIGNVVNNFMGCPDASIRSDGWNIAATILFKF